MQERAVELLETQRDLALKSINDQIEAIEKYQEKWSEAFDAYEDEVNAQAATDKLGLMWMEDVMSQKEDIFNHVTREYYLNEQKIEGYYDKEIDALEDQVDAQEKAAEKNIKSLEKQISAIEDTETEFDNLYAKIVEMFETGNVDGIPKIIEDFVTNFNGIIGNLNISGIGDNIASTITSGLESALSGTTNTVTDVSDETIESFKKEFSDLINSGNWSKEKENAILAQYGAALLEVTDDYERYKLGNQTVTYYTDTKSFTGGSSAANQSTYIPHDTDNIVSEDTDTGKLHFTNTNTDSKQQAIDAVFESGVPYKGEVYDSWTEAYQNVKNKVSDASKYYGVVYKSGSQYTAAKVSYGWDLPTIIGKYAKGTKHAPNGYAIVNEGEPYEGNSGEIINFRASGGQVIDAEKSAKLIDSLANLVKIDVGDFSNLYEGLIANGANFMPNIDLNSNLASRYIDSNRSINEDNSVTIQNINMYETNDIPDFVNKLKRQLPCTAIQKINKIH